MMATDLSDVDEPMFPQCLVGYPEDPESHRGCKHLNRSEDGFKCDAFPDGIPDQIAIGDHDHRNPFSGDNGIQFEPMED